MSDQALEEDLARIRAIVIRVLEGSFTEDDNRAYFEDDIFFFDVRHLEQHDRAWLMTILRDRAYSRDTRGLVAMQMTNEGHKELIVELFAERASN